MMFTMDMPTVPMQEAPMVLAEAAAPAAGTSPQPDYILQACGETESTGDPMSAIRGVDPAYMLKNFLYSYTQGKQIADLMAIKITLLQNPTHGNLVSHTAKNGRLYFMYDPTPDYVGNDRAVFLAQFEGKVYKIVVELHVFNYAPPGEFGASTCPEHKLIKVNKPSSGASGFGAGYSLGSIPVTFAGLPGAAVSHRAP